MIIEPLYGRELKKRSYGILQELFMEQNTASVEGKASREEWAVYASLNLQHYSLSGHSARQGI